MTEQLPTAGLGVSRGTALYLGAILGPGVLALPAIAAAAAGPAATIAWAGLLALSVPVALTFAALAAKYPDAGGVATFTRRAFGGTTARIVGWWFYIVIPVGAPAAAFIGAEYVAAATGANRAATIAIAAALIIAAFGANHAGLRLSGGTQVVLMGLLCALLAASIAIAAPHGQAANFTPFAPHGAAGVLSAAGVLFFAFAGWEAATHLSAEFTDPARQLRRVTILTLTIVTALYLSLALTTTGVLGEAAATTTVPLTALLAHGFGNTAAPVTAAIAVVLSFGAMNAFIAGASRLGAALARDGAMPQWMAGGTEPGQTPHRSLAVLAVLSGATTTAAIAWGLDLDHLMRAPAACLAAVTVLGTAAGARLLPGKTARATAIAATAFTTLVLAGLGWYLLAPAAVAVLAAAYPRLRRGSPEPAAANLQGTGDPTPLTQGAP